MTLSNVKVLWNTFWPICFKNTFHLLYYTKVSQTLYITNYKPTSEHIMV